MTIIVGVCSIVGRNLSLYGVIRVVKRVVAVVERVCVAVMVARWLWWRGCVWLRWWRCGCGRGCMYVVRWCGGGGMCGCGGGVVVVVERVCVAAMMASGCGGEGESSCSVNRSVYDKCNVAIRFGLSSPTPQDQTVFTVRTNFTSPEGLGYLHQTRKVIQGVAI